jgi:hypothetical protein
VNGDIFWQCDGFQGEVDESLDRDESEDEEEEDDEDGLEPSGFLLPPDGDPCGGQSIPPDAQARLEAFFEAAGTGNTFTLNDRDQWTRMTKPAGPSLVYISIEEGD